MLRSSLKSFASIRLVGAWFCLLAVALLWMPVVAAAWGAHVMACCDGKMCTAQGHHHTKQAQKPAKDAGAPMNCGHAGTESQTDSMMNCAVSCCKEQEQLASVGTIYVLPEAVVQNQSLAVERLTILADGRLLVVLSGPLSPPPRSNSPIA